MHSFFKFLSVICSVVCLFVYSIVLLGEKIIPDKITIIENEEYKIPDILGVDLYSLEWEEEAGVVLDTVKASQKPTEIKLLNIIPVKSTLITNSKRQYVVLGGDADDVANITTIPDMINAIATVATGVVGATLPAVTAEDNGKVLTVVDGAWAAAES